MDWMGLSMSIVNFIMVFFLSLGLYFWWISRSSSMSLLMVLVFSILSVMGFSFFLGEKIPLFMVILTLSGGLFVLISFVIMFFPGDFKNDVIYSHNMISLIFFLFCFSFFLSLEESLGDKIGGSVKIWGNFFFVYIFLIIFLFLFLFLINVVMNPSTGSMFSKKKLSGKGME